MATLRSIFKLYDGYSRTADVIERKTEKATNKILKASGATDTFNSQLEATGVSANKASGGINKLIGRVITMTGLIKGAGIADEYINTAARLDLINDGLQTRLELENKIFAAASRSRGAYSDMASAVAKMGLLAKDAFTSNDELIAFTELVQKSFKVSGADTSEQQGAMRQLSQAMASGRLMGDELVSIMENAPMIYDAIAKYTGMTKGELKEASSDGAITADIIKNAMFMAADDINDKFSKMPRNFGDIWNKIKNGATRAFRPFLQEVSKEINTEEFDAFTDKVIDGFSGIASFSGKALGGLVSVFTYVSDNWDKLVPIIEGVTGAWLAYKSALMLVKSAQWAVNFATAANPIGFVIVGITVLTAAMIYLWETSEKFREFWADMWSSNMKSAVKAYNGIVPIQNKISEWQGKYVEYATNFVNMFRGMSSVVIRIAANMAKGVIDTLGPAFEKLNEIISKYNAIAGVLGLQTIDFYFNKEGFKNAIDLLSGKAISDINSAADTVIKGFSKIQTTPWEKIDENSFNSTVDDWRRKIEDFTISGWLGELFDKAINATEGGFEDYDPLKDVVTVQGIGTNGAVKVDMSDEDLKYLRDIAEREYINKFTTATLAPNIQVTFGDVHETADADKVAGRIKQILQEEIAMTAEGAYS